MTSVNNQISHSRVDLESQLRASSWEGWEGREVWEGREGCEDRRLLELQRERADLAARNQALQETVRLMEATRLRPTKDARRTNYLSSDQDSDSIRDIRLNKETPCKDKSFGDLSMLELENRELKMKIRRLEKELADKDSELLAARKRYIADLSSNNRQDTDQYRQAALQSERLLEAREASHRQQILRLESQLTGRSRHAIPATKGALLNDTIAPGREPTVPQCSVCVSCRRRARSWAARCGGARRTWRAAAAPPATCSACAPRWGTRCAPWRRTRRSTPTSCSTRPASWTTRSRRACRRSMMALNPRSRLAFDRRLS